MNLTKNSGTILQRSPKHRTTYYAQPSKKQKKYFAQFEKKGPCLNLVEKPDFATDVRHDI